MRDGEEEAEGGNKIRKGAVTKATGVRDGGKSK